MQKTRSQSAWVAMLICPPLCVANIVKRNNTQEINSIENQLVWCIGNDGDIVYEYWTLFGLWKLTNCCYLFVFIFQSVLCSVIWQWAPCCIDKFIPFCTNFSKWPSIYECNNCYFNNDCTRLCCLRVRPNFIWKGRNWISDRDRPTNHRYLWMRSDVITNL